MSYEKSKLASRKVKNLTEHAEYLQPAFSGQGRKTEHKASGGYPVNPVLTKEKVQSQGGKINGVVQRKETTVLPKG